MPGIQPVDLQLFPNEMAIKWADDTETFIPFETLRRFCPCASCMGEKDIFGTTYRPPQRPYGNGAFDLTRIVPVGSYAIQPAWGDGHHSGIYSWEWLQQIDQAQKQT
jgi:DUF971 family protein